MIDVAIWLIGAVVVRGGLPWIARLLGGLGAVWLVLEYGLVGIAGLALTVWVGRLWREARDTVEAERRQMIPRDDVN